jgi:Protein of unknown function (DUF3592)
MQLHPQVASLICIAIGLCCGIYLIWTVIRQHESKHWPTTTGKILESNLDGDSDGWFPHVRYAYTVNKKYYMHDRLYFYDNNSSSKREALRHLSPYPIGQTVTIYYNPRKPEDSVLDRRIPLWMSLFWLFFAGFWIFVGVKIR